MLEGVSKDAVELVIRKTVDLQRWPEEQWNKEHPRFLQRSKGFVEAALQKNGALRKKEEQPLLLEEVVALRLYTGPLFEKYNNVNRGMCFFLSCFRKQYTLQNCCRRLENRQQREDGRHLQEVVQRQSLRHHHLHPHLRTREDEQALESRSRVPWNPGRLVKLCVSMQLEESCSRIPAALSDDDRRMHRT
mmetsp:Transcript_7697/g.23007  ORF Transcript_7697/g.23007 Transcript_7697/m.23007 type:complete len:190 (+) Transcript_7697:438-1007(+)